MGFEELANGAKHQDLRQEAALEFTKEIVESDVFSNLTSVNLDEYLQGDRTIRNLTIASCRKTYSTKKYLKSFLPRGVKGQC